MILALTVAAVLGGVELPRKPSAVTTAPIRNIDCRARYARSIAGSAAPGTRKLGELPPGLRMHAVLKTVDGCPVNVLMERGPDGQKLEVPARPGRLTPAPASESQRRGERNR